ncbi:extracellular solute-binding protein [Peribacillus loiseleuriae]|uniref:ABC transporter substrate-binding protein n=1 Tax=Peribacillus loiseleuriae TaxID=1679170 RepID=UPI0037F1CB56
MKKFLLLAITAILTFALAACSNGSTAKTNSSNSEKSDSKNGQTSGITTTIDKPVTIEFWHAMTGHLGETLQKMTDEFNHSQENITVKLVSQGNYGDLSKKVMASAKARTLPVMSQAYEDWMTQYIQNDLITDLTPYVQDEKYGWTDEEYNDIVKVFRDANTWDGKLYGVPFNKSTEILYYNTDMFKENNLAAPTTWEELRNAAQKLTNKDKKVVGLGLENSIGTSFPTWVRQAGGTFLDEGSNKIMFDSPEGKEALEFLNGMMVDGIARLAGEDEYMSNPFGRGDTGIYIGSSAGIPFVSQAAEGNINWSAAPLPKGKVGATSFQGTNITVFSSATDEEKLAAWEYLKFMTSKEQTVFWAKETGYIPVRTSALEDPTWKQYIEENPVYGVGQLQFESGFYDPRPVGAFDMKNVVSKEVQSVLLGQKTVDQGLADAAKGAQDALDKAK